MTTTTTTKPIPDTLNGFPVIDYVERGRNGTFSVLVERPLDYHHPWVVATWHPNMGDAWSWGHYHDDRNEARRELMAIAAKATRINLHS